MCMPIWAMVKLDEPSTSASSSVVERAFQSDYGYDSESERELQLFKLKMHNPEPCYLFEPPDEMLEKSKKATWEYNKERSKI